MRITSQGRVTIPRHIRQSYGFTPGVEVDFIEQNGAVVLEIVESSPDAAARFVAKLRGSVKVGLSTDDIMRLTRDYDLD